MNEKVLRFNELLAQYRKGEKVDKSSPEKTLLLEKTREFSKLTKDYLKNAISITAIEFVNKLELLRKEIEELKASTGSSLKEDITALRSEILEGTYLAGDDWPLLVDMVSAEPHILTALIMQSSYLDGDNDKTLFKPPFSKSITRKGAGKRWTYTAELEDGTTVVEGSIKKLAMNFDEIGEDEGKANLSWAGLNKCIGKVKIDGVSVVGIEREEGQDGLDTDDDE